MMLCLGTETVAWELWQNETAKSSSEGELIFVDDFFGTNNEHRHEPFKRST